MTECGDGIHKLEDCEWGSWLLVNFDRPGGTQGAGRGMGQNGDGAGRAVALAEGEGTPVTLTDKKG